MPSGTAAFNGEVMLMFGDMKMATTFGNRRGVTVSQTDDRWFEYDQVGIRGTQRYDIVVHDIGDNTDAGPLVGLVGTT